MICPSCGVHSKDNTYCDNCKANLALYNKVHVMAVRLYNTGLHNAQERNLTTAIENLSTCLRIDKYYIDARNLLGLVYWEIGEVGQAIKQWVISSSYQKENNQAKYYLNQIQKLPNKLERYKEAIALYNNSLEHMKRGSDDIAIISLKKAIAQNPKYIAPKSLLCLYYTTHNQKPKAKEILEDIFKIDKAHINANRYKAELDFSLANNKAVESPKEQARIVKPMQFKTPRHVENMIRPKSTRGTIIAFLLGAICMFIMYGVAIVPSKLATLEENIKQAKNAERELQAKLQNAIETKEEEISKLQAQNETLAKENEEIHREKKIQAQIQSIQKAEELFKTRQPIEAAEILTGIDKSYIPQDNLPWYDGLMTQVYPQASEQLYKMGYNEYQKKNYNEARQLLEKSFLYEKEQYYSDNTLYIIGRSYEAEGDMEKAKQYYQSVVDKYPGTDGANNAKGRL